jgi:predicted DNA-binding protein
MSKKVEAGVSDSRTADKFVLRLEDGQKPQIEALAKQQRRAMNSWIIEAIAEKLERAQRQELLLDALEKAVKGETVISGTQETLDRLIAKLHTAVPGSKVLQ